MKEKNGILKTVLVMSIPAIIESFFTAFAGLVDSLMVSSLGAHAVAAVGLTTQPKFVGLAVFFAINVALSALVARRFGEKKRDDANGIFATALVVTFLFVGIISTLMVILAPQIISLCGSTVETHGDAVLYLRIIMGGIIFQCIQMVVNSAQRGAGNTRITMRTNITSNTVNMIFNYLLINGHFGFPALGIKGAAIATVLGSAVAAVMALISVMNMNCFVSIPHIFKNRILPKLCYFISIVKVGYSVFFEQVLIRIGFMSTALMAADQGMKAMAAHQVGMNLMGLSFSFGDGLQAAAVALIGRSLGEQNPDLAKKYGGKCQAVGGVISVVLAVVYFFGAGVLMRMFFDEPEIVNIGINIVRIIILVVLFQIRQVVYMGGLRGAGDTLYTAVVSMVSVTIVRTLASYVFCYPLGLGVIGIWLGVAADQVVRFVFAAIRFRSGKWVKIKI